MNSTNSADSTVSKLPAWPLVPMPVPREGRAVKPPQGSRGKHALKKRAAWKPMFRAAYESLLKVNPALRRVYEERKNGFLPDDEMWMRELWPAVFPTVWVSQTDGHTVSIGNGLDQLRNFERLQTEFAGRLVYRVLLYGVTTRGLMPREAVVVWNVEAALFVLDLLRDEFKLVMDAALAHHRVRKSRPERRRRERGLPQFSYEKLLKGGADHLAEQWDVRVPGAPDAAWGLPLLVEALIAIPPYVRRIWVAWAGLTDPAPKQWGLAYPRDVVEQLKRTVTERLVDDGHSHHPLLGASVVDLEVLKEEWKIAVHDSWHPSLGALVEPVTRMNDILKIVVRATSGKTPTAQRVEMTAFLDEVASWVLTRLIGTKAPGRFWIDHKERTEMQRFLVALLRPHFAAVDLPTWARTYHSDDTPLRETAAYRAVYDDAFHVLEAVTELATDRTFLATAVRWRPGADPKPVIMLLKRMKDRQGTWAEDAGVMPRERIIDHTEVYRRVFDQAVAEDAQDQTDARIDVEAIIKTLNKTDAALVASVLHGDQDFDELPARLRERVRGVALGVAARP